MDDCLIIGGGVIGLSLAYDLSSHGCAVSVIDQGEMGREASWAGAGIIPTYSAGEGSHALEQLQALSGDLHADWADALRQQTGIDTGYRRCGGIQVARSRGEAALIRAGMKMLPDEGIRVEPLHLNDLSKLAPNLTPAVARGVIQAAFHLPDEAQIRNPDHLAALTEACRLQGVALRPHTPALDITLKDDQIQGVTTRDGVLRAGQYCFTAGAWTVQLLAALGISTGIFPVRGQMILFQAAKPPLRQIVSEGSRYIVPRDDGLVLVGSCEEEVGFRKGTTVAVIEDLKAMAFDLLPCLQEAKVNRSWSGLRPGSFDGFPYLGSLPFENGLVAAGHFRSGLFLSTGTAIVMSELIRCGSAPIDLSPFSVGRGRSGGRTPLSSTNEREV